MSCDEKSQKHIVVNYRLNTEIEKVKICFVSKKYLTLIFIVITYFITNNIQSVSEA